MSRLSFAVLAFVYALPTHAWDDVQTYRSQSATGSPSAVVADKENKGHRPAHSNSSQGGPEIGGQRDPSYIPKSIKNSDGRDETRSLRNSQDHS